MKTKHIQTSQFLAIAVTNFCGIEGEGDEIVTPTKKPVNNFFAIFGEKSTNLKKITGLHPKEMENKGFKKRRNLKKALERSVENK